MVYYCSLRQVLGALMRLLCGLERTGRRRMTLQPPIHDWHETVMNHFSDEPRECSCGEGMQLWRGNAAVAES